MQKNDNLSELKRNLFLIIPFPDSYDKANWNTKQILGWNSFSGVRDFAPK